MKHFSQEYLEHLQNEHRLTTAAIINLRNNPRKYMQVDQRRNQNQNHLDQVFNTLEQSRIELESKIDVLSDFLNG